MNDEQFTKEEKLFTGIVDNLDIRTLSISKGEKQKDGGIIYSLNLWVVNVPSTKNITIATHRQSWKGCYDLMNKVFEEFIFENKLNQIKERSGKQYPTRHILMGTRDSVVQGGCSLITNHKKQDWIGINLQMLDKNHTSIMIQIKGEYYINDSLLDQIHKVLKDVVGIGIL